MKRDYETMRYINKDIPICGTKESYLNHKESIKSVLLQKSTTKEQKNKTK